MNKHIEKTNYADKAKALYKQGFLCSQAVLAAFAEELGLSEEQALKLGACFGGGMCKGEVCRACTGALMVLGLKYGQCVPGAEGRIKTNNVTVSFLDRFRSENGSYMCKELLGCDLTTQEGKEYARERGLFADLCPEMVASAAELTEQLLNE